MTPKPVLLALRALGLGDLLTAIPALRALADHFTEHHLVLATPQSLAPLARHAGVADTVVHAAGLAPLDRRLARPRVAVNLHGRGPQSHRLLAALEPARTIAFANEEVPGTGGEPVWLEDEHEVARWCRLLAESGIAADPTRLAIEPPFRPAPPRSAGATLLHPGAAAPSRRWPVERWAAVARAERAQGRTVVVTGAADEVALAHRLAGLAGLPRDAVLAGRTEVLDLAAAVAAAARVVVGDTGVAHLATALGTPSVVLFGTMPPSRWGPPPGRLHRALWAGGDPPLSEARHHPSPALLAIGVDDVLDALEDLPARGQATAPTGAGGLRLSGR